MTTFQGYKGRIERATTLAELREVARQIKADKSPSGKDRLVLDAAIARRFHELDSGPEAA